MSLMIERYDCDTDIGELDLDSCQALLDLVDLWIARRALRWRWQLRAKLVKGT